MSLISDWVIQIIIFIFIGTILELIIPNNTMKKYIQIVVGLILLLVLAKPILYMFSVHIPTVVEEVEQSVMVDDNLLNLTKKQMNIKKDEIQSEQDAYIWNEVTAQLIYEADSVLEQQFPGTSIQDITIVTSDETKADLAHLEKIVVILHKGSSANDEIAPVQPVEIGETKSTHTPVETKEGNQIRDTLATVWGIDATQIEYIWEEGDT